MSALAATVLYSCTKPSADEHPNPNPGSETVEPVPVTSDIKSILELNDFQDSLNSHAADWQSSSMELDYRTYYSIASPIISAVNANYPRLKKLYDGTFLLIFQQGLTAKDIYYAKSTNLLTWQKSETPLFANASMKQYGTTTTDQVLYSSADAIVLDNGDILAFAAFRLNNGFRLNDKNNGVMMKRSSNNGKSWSDTTVIFRGTCWEPSALQLSTGEVQVYFTKSNVTTGDSGTRMLSSTDRGKTWKNVGFVVRQNAGKAADGSGTTIYTDQMPVAIQLNGSKDIAVAVESRFGRTGTSSDQYHLSMAYSSDDWASGGLTGSQEGPSDRKSNLFLNEAAPYLRQFRSGETVLLSGASSMCRIRVGNATAREFGDPMQVFNKKGCWGSIEILDGHSAVVVFPNTTTASDGSAAASIQIGRLILNHRISATNMTPTMKGSNSEWTNVKAALFIGSLSQAQSSFRFAFDDKNLYCLVERLDNNLTAADIMELMIQSGSGSGTPLTLKFTPNTTAGTLTCANTDIKFATEIAGNFDGVANDSGYLIEIAIPLTALKVESNRILFNAVLHDPNGDDTFSGLTSSNYEKWIPIELKKAVTPTPDPGTGNLGNTPKWEEGTELDF